MGAWHALALMLVGVASGALPSGPDGGVLGPDGIEPVLLADLPDIRAELRIEDGALVLRDRESGAVQPDGVWPEGTVTHWPDPTGGLLVRADDNGRLESVIWASGRRMRIERDAGGRVVAVYGPGTNQRRVSYDAGVRVEDTLGTKWSAFEDDQRVWVVRDGVGRQVRLELEPETGRIQSWEDPRGFVSTVHERGDVTDVVGPGGAVWRVGALEGGGFLETPDGLRWSWDDHPSGEVRLIRDPLGLEARWEYDASGRMLMAELGGRRQSVERDASGRITSWTDALGARLQLRWDGERVSQVIDASGAAVTLERDATGRVEALLTRSGGRWVLEYDLDGNLNAVQDPAGRVLKMSHNGSGRVVGASYQERQIRLDRDSAGRIVGVVDPRGVRTGLVRDPTGRVRTIRQVGASMQIERDAAGEMVTVRRGAAEVFIRRDVAGRPISAGPITWTRDLMGWIDKMVSPGIALTFGRDAVGRLTSVRSEDSTLKVSRNLLGEPMHWQGADADVRVERDAAGRISLEAIGDTVLRVLRGVRGQVERIEAARGVWRWSRGADAALLRVEGPDGVGVGADRDLAGRLVFARMPGGGMVRRAFEDGLVVEQVDDAGGTVVAQAAWSPDVFGRIAWAQVDDGPLVTWKTGPDGALVAIESDDTPDENWSFSQHMDRGSGGWVRVGDMLGRTTELMVGETWPAWGAVGGAWAYQRSEAGALERVTGADGAFDVEHDQFGKLSTVRTTATEWQIQWDAMGRPQRLVRPGGAMDVLWGPGQVTGTPLATGTNGETAWMDIEGGALAWSRERRDDVTPSAGAILLPGGLGARVEDALGVVRMRWGYQTGVADSAVLDPLGGRGGISLFAGGPELFVGGALDAASSERTDGTLDWPWSVDVGQARVARTVWDPAGWEPQSDWGAPVRIAEKLGLVDVPLGQGSERLPTAYAWLPGSVQDVSAPIGPPRGRVDVAAELPPLEARILEHLSAGEGGLGWDVVVGAVVTDAEIGHLPPGVHIGGLERGSREGQDFSRAEMAKKVVAGWGGLL